MGSLAAPRQSEQRATRPVIPRRGAEPERGWHEDDSGGILAVRSEVVALGARRDQAEIVAEPVDVRTGSEHDRLQTPLKHPALRPTNDRETAVRGSASLSWCVAADDHVEHPPGPERDFGDARAHTRLSDHRGLLIADDGSD